MHSPLKLSVLLVALLVSSLASADAIRSITVKGEGEAEAPPDYILIFASVSSDNKDADRAKKDVDQRMRAVIDAIEAFRIETRDVAFGGASLSPTFKYDKNDNEIPVGYRVARTVSLKLRDISSYEQLIHALVSAGANEIDDPNSKVDDRNKLELAALQQAAANARANATAIANTLSVKLGNPIDVGEGRLQPYGPFRQAYADDTATIEEIRISSDKRGISDPLLFVPANIKAKATVWVRFELLPK